MANPKPPNHEEMRKLTARIFDDEGIGEHDRSRMLSYIAAAEQTERDLKDARMHRQVFEDKLNEYIDKTKEAEQRAREAERERDELKAKLEKITARRFPILGGGPLLPRSVPWSLLEPNEARARDNHDQSLERLASRGGLGPAEMMAVLRNEKWSKRTFKTDEDAATELARILAALDENARLAAVLREHSSALVHSAERASFYANWTREERAAAYAAAKALAEVLK